MQGPQKVAQMFTIVSLYSAKMLSSAALPSRSVVEKSESMPAVSAASLWPGEGSAAGAAWPQAESSRQAAAASIRIFFMSFSF